MSKKSKPDTSYPKQPSVAAILKLINRPKGLLL
jgi:hypothetical protein